MTQHRTPDIEELVDRVSKLERFFEPEFEGDDTDTELGLVDLAEVLAILKGEPEQ